MSPQQVTLVFSRLGSYAGAEGTMTDMCRALMEAGHRCRVLVGKSTVASRRKLRQHLEESSSSRGQVRVIPASRLLDFRVAPGVRRTDFVGPDRLPVTSLRFLANPGRLSAKRALTRSNCTVLGDVLTPRGLDELTSLAGRSGLVLHHNGEPKDFFLRWLTDTAPSPVPDQGGKTGSYVRHLSRFVAIVFQSDAQRRMFEKDWHAATSIRFVFWPSCDENRVKELAQTASPLPDGRFNVVCVAKFQPAKGQLALLEAVHGLVKEFPELHITFVGGSVRDQSYRDRCLKYTADNDLHNFVSFTGPRVDAAAFTAHCDLFALTSRAEGVSRAIREAAMLAKPILATQLPGTTSFLSPDGAFLVPGQQPDEIKGLLRSVITDRTERLRRAGIASNRYQTLANWQTFSDALTRMVAEIAGQGPTLARRGAQLDRRETS